MRVVLGRACVALGVLLAAVVGVVAGPLAGKPAAVAPSGARGCRVSAPVTAAGYARAFAALGQGGDSTVSVRLPSGRVAWLFADTVIPGVGIVHSTAVVQDGGCFTASRATLLPDDADGSYWWPTAAVALPDGRVIVTAGNGFSGMRERAALLVETPTGVEFRQWLGFWPQAWSARGPLFGAGLLVDGGTLRVYGTALTGSFGKQLYLASVPLGALGDPAAWTVDRRPLWGAVPHGVDTRAAPYRDAAGYHVVTIEDSVYGGGPVIALDGPTAAGPFRARELFRYARPGQVRYDAEVHPEAALSGGLLLVTVNNNWPVDDHTLHPVASYLPSFFAVRP